VAALPYALLVKRARLARVMKLAAGEMQAEVAFEVVVAKALASVGHSIHGSCAILRPTYLDYDGPSIPGPASSTDPFHDSRILFCCGALRQRGGFLPFSLHKMPGLS